MKKNIFRIRKAVVFMIISGFIAVTFTPFISSDGNTNSNDKPIDVLRNNQPVLSLGEIVLKQKELYRSMNQGSGWYWKPSYLNYAPSGMPDFDEKQDQWKAIEPGPDGIIQSQPAGDDILNVTENRIAPGPDCTLQTVPAGDDVVVWAFCGPVVVANCFWWFDSKYADPTGTPGDGKDNFPLVSNYGAGDDHSAANVPLLIKNLAVAMKTTSKGTTYINDMQNAIHQWFIDKGLSNNFTEITYNKPTFLFVENEIERSQDVILLIGYYNRMKVVDQQQILWNQMVDLPHMTGHLQSFTPSVNVLDAVQVLLQGNFQIPTPVKVCIWNQLPVQGLIPLGASQMAITPSVTTPLWYQFHFDPSISLTPGALYYISVDELGTTHNINWCYKIPDNYAGGMAFWEGPPWVFTPQSDKDFAFKTEYYGTEGYKIGGHYLTCAGVNSQDHKIGVSDPCWDIQNPTIDPTKHNDAQFVSHDIYNVTLGCPVSNYDYQWWLPDFPADYDYTIVEQVVVICPINSPPNQPSKPRGPTTGVTGVQYQYNTSATDPDHGDQIKYGWDSNNDGIVEHWTGYYASGATCTVGVTFASSGTYYLSVVAEDNHGAQSAFSSVLTVVISPNNPPTVSITSPLSGATVSSTINIQGTASDSDGTVTQVEVRIDNGSWWTTSGTTSWTTSWDTTTVSDGSHTIYASSKDNNGAYSTLASVLVTVKNAGNNPPNKPVKPSGQLRGKIGVSYPYSSSTTDPDGDQLYYWFDWGDGTNSGWVGPFASGIIANANHTWTIKNIYSIKVKAKDTSGAESPWSDPLSVTMPFSYSINVLFWEQLVERFPHAFPVLRHLLGY